MAKQGAPPLGIDPVRTDPRPAIPTQLQASFLLWLVAVAAGLFETALVVVDATDGEVGSAAQVTVGVAIRLLVFTAAIYLAAQLRQGGNRARVALAVLLGGIGTGSLVIGPATWLAEGGSLADVVAVVLNALGFGGLDVPIPLGAASGLAWTLLAIPVARAVNRRGERLGWLRLPGWAGQAGLVGRLRRQVHTARTPGAADQQAPLCVARRKTAAQRLTTRVGPPRTINTTTQPPAGRSRPSGGIVEPPKDLRCPAWKHRWFLRPCRAGCASWSSAASPSRK
jgi:hypothetical protein